MAIPEKSEKTPTLAQVQAKASHYLSEFDKELAKYPAFNTLEERLQVPKTHTVLGIFLLLPILRTLPILAVPLSNLIGWALPAHLSLKSIQAPSRHDDAQWLMYWVIFGVITFFESFTLPFVLDAFPWYLVFKTIFVIWLQLPAIRGAQKIYNSIFPPLKG